MPSYTITVGSGLFEDLKLLAEIDERKSWEDSIDTAVVQWVEERKRQILRNVVEELNRG
jgi:hypothetical protein